MVFYFTSNVVSPPVVIYMGKDKYENDELIRWGWPEDVWFHVDNLSSAHLYLRLQKGQTIDDIPSALLTDVAQLTKANSIQGCKTNNVDIIYTMWSNLKKTAGMEPGQVVFFRNEDVKKIHVEKKINEIVNRLNKTKIEEHPDLRQQREERDGLERQEEKNNLRTQMQREREEKKKQELEAEMRSYGSLLKSDRMKTNRDDGNDSDEFM